MGRLGAASMITMGAASELRSSSRPTRQGRGKAKGSRLEVVMNQVMDIDKVCGVVKNMWHTCGQCDSVCACACNSCGAAYRVPLPLCYRIAEKKKKKKKKFPWVDTLL